MIEQVIKEFLKYMEGAYLMSPEEVFNEDPSNLSDWVMIFFCNMNNIYTMKEWDTGKRMAKMIVKKIRSLQPQWKKG